MSYRYLEHSAHSVVFEDTRDGSLHTIMLYPHQTPYIKDVKVQETDGVFSWASCPPFLQVEEHFRYYAPDGCEMFRNYPLQMDDSQFSEFCARHAYAPAPLPEDDRLFVADVETDSGYGVGVVFSRRDGKVCEGDCWDRHTMEGDGEPVSADCWDACWTYVPPAPCTVKNFHDHTGMRDEGRLSKYTFLRRVAAPAVFSADDEASLRMSPAEQMMHTRPLHYGMRIQEVRNLIADVERDAAEIGSPDR